MYSFACCNVTYILSIDLHHALIVCRKFKLPFYGQAPSLYGQTLIFFPNPPPLLTIIFDDIPPIKYRLNTYVNSRGKVIS